MTTHGCARSVRMQGEPLSPWESRAAGEGLTGARRGGAGAGGGTGAASFRRGSSSERVNETPPCIEMLIVKIVYYLRKVI